MPEPAERKPFLLKAGEGESVWSLGGRFTAKATAAATEERFALVESVAFQSSLRCISITGRTRRGTSSTGR